jgi:hypothetical protein
VASAKWPEGHHGSSGLILWWRNRLKEFRIPGHLCAAIWGTALIIICRGELDDRYSVDGEKCCNIFIFNSLFSHVKREILAFVDVSDSLVMVTSVIILSLSAVTSAKELGAAVFCTS